MLQNDCLKEYEMNDVVIVLRVLIVIIVELFMQITNFLLDIFIFFTLYFVVRLIRKNMHIYQVPNTLSQSHDQLQIKNIHVNFLFLAYGKCSI